MASQHQTLLILSDLGHLQIYLPNTSPKLLQDTTLQPLKILLRFDPHHPQPPSPNDTPKIPTHQREATEPLGCVSFMIIELGEWWCGSTRSRLEVRVGG